jgi:hypothetical protein
LICHEEMGQARRGKGPEPAVDSAEAQAAAAAQVLVEAEAVWAASPWAPEAAASVRAVGRRQLTKWAWPATR